MAVRLMGPSCCDGGAVELRTTRLAGASSTSDWGPSIESSRTRVAVRPQPTASERTEVRDGWTWAASSESS